MRGCLVAGLHDQGVAGEGWQLRPVLRASHPTKVFRHGARLFGCVLGNVLTSLATADKCFRRLITEPDLHGEVFQPPRSFRHADDMQVRHIVPSRLTLHKGTIRPFTDITLYSHTERIPYVRQR